VSTDKSSLERAIKQDLSARLENNEKLLSRVFNTVSDDKVLAEKIVSHVVGTDSSFYVTLPERLFERNRWLSDQELSMSRSFQIFSQRLQDAGLSIENYTWYNSNSNESKTEGVMFTLKMGEELESHIKAQFPQKNNAPNVEKAHGLELH